MIQINLSFHANHVIRAQQHSWNGGRVANSRRSSPFPVHTAVPSAILHFTGRTLCESKSPMRPDAICVFCFWNALIGHGWIVETFYCDHFVTSKNKCSEIWETLYWRNGRYKEENVLPLIWIKIIINSNKNVFPNRLATGGNNSTPGFRENDACPSHPSSWRVAKMKVFGSSCRLYLHFVLEWRGKEGDLAG